MTDATSYYTEPSVHKWRPACVGGRPERCEYCNTPRTKDTEFNYCSVGPYPSGHSITSSVLDEFHKTFSGEFQE